MDESDSHEIVHPDPTLFKILGTHLHRVTVAYFFLGISLGFSVVDETCDFHVVSLFIVVPVLSLPLAYGAYFRQTPMIVNGFLLQTMIAGFLTILLEERKNFTCPDIFMTMVIPIINTIVSFVLGVMSIFALRYLDPLALPYERAGTGASALMQVRRAQRICLALCRFSFIATILVFIFQSQLGDREDQPPARAQAALAQVFVLFHIASIVSGVRILMSRMNVLFSCFVIFTLVVLVFSEIERSSKRAKFYAALFALSVVTTFALVVEAACASWVCSLCPQYLVVLDESGNMTVVVGDRIIQGSVPVPLPPLEQAPVPVENSGIAENEGPQEAPSQAPLPLPPLRYVAFKQAGEEGPVLGHVANQSNV